MTNIAKAQKVFKEFEKEILRIRKEQKKIIQKLEEDLSSAEIDKLKERIKNLN